MMELKRKATVPHRETMTKDSIIHMKRMKAETVVGVGLLSTEQVVVSWSNRMFGDEVMGCCDAGKCKLILNTILERNSSWLDINNQRRGNID